MPGPVTTDSSGISTYCVEGQECDTQITAYKDYVWDSDNESLSATGIDNLGAFTLSGVVNETGDGYIITKTYISAPMNVAFKGEPAVFTITSKEVPTDANYFFSEFTFTSNIGPIGKGRF